MKIIKMPSRRIGKVLRLMDEAASPWFRAFPNLEGAFWFVASRLSCYADCQQWCLLIEVVEVDPSAPGHLGITTILYSLSDPPGKVRPLADANFLHLTADGSSAPTFLRGRNGVEYVNPRAKQLLVRRSPIRLPSSTEYTRRGIKLKSGSRLMKHELVRCLATARPGSLFATEREIRDRTGLQLGAPILRLDEWRHPRIGDEELPSATRTFQMIAKVLATGDRSAYKQVEEPNNDWRHWPDCEDV